jgi:hypothetical protein
MATTFMGLSLPTPGPGGTAGPAYATLNNDAFELVDSHDHSAGKGALVTPAGLNINSDLSIGSNHLNSVKSLRMTNESATLAGASDVRSVYAVGGDLYYNNGAGTAVQITSGAGLNASSIGGIGGDYATSTAAVTYSDTTKTFSFTQDSGEAANMAFGDFDLIEPATPGAKAVTFKSPSALAAPYNLTMFAALPGSSQVVRLTAGGVLQSTNTLDNLTLTSPTINGGALSGTFSGAHTCSGVATFSANPVITDVTNAFIEYKTTGGGADEKNWRVGAQSGVFLLQTRTDADGFGANIISGTRSGVNVPTLVFSAALVPNASGARNLGSASLEWGDAYFADGKKLYFGSTQEMNLSWPDDGNSEAELLVTTEGGAKLHLGAGLSASEDIEVGGLLPDAIDTTGNSTTSTGTIYTFTLPADFIGRDSRGLRISVIGTQSGVGSPVLQLRLNGVVLSTITLTGGTSYCLEAALFRTGATTGEILRKASDLSSFTPSGGAITGLAWGSNQTLDLNISSNPSGAFVGFSMVYVEVL